MVYRYKISYQQYFLFTPTPKVVIISPYYNHVGVFLSTARHLINVYSLNKDITPETPLAC